MNIRKLHRLCSVKGCKNTVSYNISRSREIGGSVIICRECLEEANKAVIGMENVPIKKENITETPKKNTKKKTVDS